MQKISEGSNEHMMIPKIIGILAVALFPLKKVKAFNPNHQKTQKLSDFGKRIGLEVDVVNQP